MENFDRSIKEFIENWNNFKPEHKSKGQRDLLIVFINGLEIQQNLLRVVINKQ